MFLVVRAIALPETCVEVLEPSCFEGTFSSTHLLSKLINAKQRSMFTMDDPICVWQGRLHEKDLASRTQNFLGVKM